MTDSDLTVSILREIRDDAREFRREMNELRRDVNDRFFSLERHVEITNSRLGSLETHAEITNGRLGIIEHTLVDASSQLVFTVRSTKNIERRHDREIDELRERVDALETTVGKPTRP